MPRPGAGKTLLLVDDERDVREMASEYLRGHGLRGIEAESGVAALRLILAGMHFDVLVSEIGSPGGVHIVRAARTTRQTCLRS